MDAECSTSNTRGGGHTRKKRKSDVDVEAEPQQMKPKATLRRKAGRLANLPDLPLDVLFEIFGHLHPHDLLKLARMTKEFRRVLMHSSSVSVWKMALENVPGLPPCPPSMTEVQWVNLAFSPHCHFCFTLNVRNVEWRFRIRMCTKCAKTRLQECDTYTFFRGFEVDHTDSRPNFETMIPWRSGKHLTAVCMTEDYNWVKAEYYSLESGPDRKAFIKGREAAVDEIIKHARLCEAWAKGQTNDRSKELDEIRTDRRKAIKKKLVDLGWEKDLASIEYPDSFNDHKLVKQPQRLTERIWNNIKAPMLEYMEKIRVKRLDKERRVLVIDRKRSAVKILRAYKNARLPCTELMPEPPDFCDFPMVKAILQLSSEVTVDESSFADIIPQLPDLFDIWRQGVQRDMIDIIKRSETVPREVTRRRSDFYSDEEECFVSDEEQEQELTDEGALAKMALATTVFSCKYCKVRDAVEDYDSDDSVMDGTFSMSRRPLFYPQVMGHTCLTREARSMLFRNRRIPDSSIDLERGEYRARAQWTSSLISVDRMAYKLVSEIVTHTVLDPTFATIDEMDDLDMKFACTHCRSTMVDGEIKRDWSGKELIEGQSYHVQLFTWREIVQHYLEMRGSGNLSHLGVQIRTLTREEFDALPSASFTKRPEPPVDCLADQYWLCVHCRDLPSEKAPMLLDVLKAHLLDAHELSEPTVNRDYYKGFAALECCPTVSSSRIVWLVEMEL